MVLFRKRAALPADLAAVPEDQMRKVASQLHSRHSRPQHAPCQYETAARKLIARGRYDMSDLPMQAKGRNN